jgi:hypothetical protein
MKRVGLLLVLLISTILCSCGWQAKPAAPAAPSTFPAQAPDKARIVGKIILQGRMAHGGTKVTVGDLPPVTTIFDGSYAVSNVPTGQYFIKAVRPGYLCAQGYVTITIAGETRTLPPVTLMAGDLNEDGQVDLFDLVRMTAAFGTQDIADPRADLTGDGKLNLFDMTLAGNNLGQTGPLVLESP